MYGMSLCFVYLIDMIYWNNDCGLMHGHVIRNVGLYESMVISMMNGVYMMYVYSCRDIDG